MNLLIDSSRDAWRDRHDFHVNGNMAIYFSETQALKNDFRAPDVFVVLDTERRERKRWVVWEEDLRTPDVVIELLPSSDERTQAEAKRAKAEAERAKAEAERIKADAERARRDAERAEAELARLREELRRRGD